MYDMISDVQIIHTETYMGISPMLSLSQIVYTDIIA